MAAFDPDVNGTGSKPTSGCRDFPALRHNHYLSQITPATTMEADLHAASHVALSLDFTVLAPFGQRLLEALWTTTWMSVTCFVASLVFGAFGVVARMSNVRIIRYSTRGYVEIFRGLPLLVTLYVFYFGLPTLGIAISGYQAGLFAMTAVATAYMIEIYRGGLAGVPEGQTEAGHALGLRRTTLWLQILLPQAAIIALPAIGNQLVGIILGTSLVSLIGVQDLTFEGYYIGSVTFEYMSIFLVIAAVYFTLSQLSTKVFDLASDRLRRRIAQ
jgi:polar amino acid transport system permease protein